MTVQDAARLKEDGNKAFADFRLLDAIQLYSRAIAATPGSAVLYGNRSAPLFEAGRYGEALEDIQTALDGGADTKLAAKLALRAARCALWTADLDTAEQWLKDPAIVVGSEAICIAAEQCRACCGTLSTRCHQSCTSPATTYLRALWLVRVPGRQRAPLASCPGSQCMKTNQMS